MTLEVGPVIRLTLDAESLTGDERLEVFFAGRPERVR